MRKPFSIASLVCVPLIACGGSDNNSKTVTLHDAKVFMDGSAAGSCSVPATYAALGNLGAVVDHPTGSNSEFMQLYTSLGSADATLAILITGGTDWPTAITGGSDSPSIALTAADGDINTCEICFFVSAGGFDMTAMTLGIKDPTDVYMGNAGAIKILQRGVNGGSAGSNTNYFVATVSNLHFHHVNFDENAGTTTEIPDGCTTSIGSGEYGYLPQAGSAAFTGAINVQVVNTPMTQQEKAQLVLGRRHI